MEDLPFYANLTEVQKSYADKIAAKAREAGVSPKLAVSIAYQESRLNPKVGRGSAGEIGIMQIKPGTAKEVGFSSEDLADPDKNIEAGLRYLKRSLDLSEGNEKLAAAGYNAGVNHPFFSEKKSNLPETTVAYLKNLNSYGAFAQPKEGVEVEEPGQTLDSLEAQKMAEDRGQEILSERGKVIGGGAGALVSAGKAVPAAFKGVGRAIGKRIEEGKLAADIKAGVVPSPTQPVAPSAAPGGQSVFPKATGPGSATFNYARSYGLPELEAGRALGTGKQSGEVWDLLNKRQEALTNIQQRFPTETYTENPRFKGLMTPDQGVGSGPRASFVSESGGLRQLPAKVPISTAPSGLEQVTQLFRSMIEPGSKLRMVGSAAFKYGAPPLALYQAGGEFGTALGEAGKEKPDYAKMALSGIGGAGALMSMFPVTAPIGIPLAIGAPAIQYMREQGGKENVPTEVSPMGDVVAP